MLPGHSEQQVVHPDTQAVLLLCAAFSRDEAREPRRLTLREYNGLASWLGNQGHRPADLLDSSRSILPADEPTLPDLQRLQALLGRGMQLATALELWHRLGIWVMSRAEQCYPERLRRQLGNAAPALLYGIGDQARLALGGLAVVGSRAADEECLAFTSRVAERCASSDLQVVSGGARGVDQTAVRAALEAEGGALVVLADRLDRAATARDAREPLRSGKVTIVSPFEPESIFQVGRAMERNKVIYAFSDAALVVRFTAGEGGTWTGAVEQLGRNKTGRGSIPVFIRLADNPEEGCRQLLGKCATPFPEDRFWSQNLNEVLRESAGAAAGLFESAPAAKSSIPASALHEETSGHAEPTAPISASVAESIRTAAIDGPPAADAYEQCLPTLLQLLRDEPGVKELPAIARKLEITQKQLKKWLQRGVEEGKITKERKQKSIVYCDASLPQKSNLFGHGGDAA